MSKQEKQETKAIKRKSYILIGVVIGVIIAASSLAGYQLVAQAERSNTDIQEQAIIAIQNNPELVYEAIKGEVTYEIDASLTNERIDIDEDINGVNVTANLALSKARNLENRFLIIEATGEISTTSPISGADYELTCLQVSGQTVLGCEYSQDQVIYIRGQAPDNVGQFNWGIKKGTQLLASSQSSVPSNGVFIFVWNVGGDEQLTSYKAIVEINGKIDTVDFEIK